MHEITANIAKQCGVFHVWILLYLSIQITCQCHAVMKWCFMALCAVNRSR